MTDSSTPAKQPQRRLYPRYPLMLWAEHAEPTRYFAEWTENLSAGGLFLRTEHQFMPGEIINLRLSFPGLLGTVEVDGRVAWIRPASPMQPGGIGFEVANDRGRRCLADLALRASQPAPSARPAPFRVLVVEDNPRVSRSYERVLHHLAKTAARQIELVFATNGHAALELVAEKTPDLVITDIYMPVMDGFTLIEKLRMQEETAHLPLIIITGGRAGERERASQMGITAFLQKPIQFGQLLETIVCLLPCGG